MFWLKTWTRVARLQVYVAITYYTLLHQATRGEGKNSLKELKDILVSDLYP